MRKRSKKIFELVRKAYRNKLSDKEGQYIDPMAEQKYRDLEEIRQRRRVQEKNTGNIINLVLIIGLVSIVLMLFGLVGKLLN